MSIPDLPIDVYVRVDWRSYRKGDRVTLNTIQEYRGAVKLPQVFAFEPVEAEAVHIAEETIEPEPVEEKPAEEKPKRRRRRRKSAEAKTEPESDA